MLVTEEYLNSLVCERFREDAKYRQGHVNVIAAAPGTRILGVHTPEMKQAARELVRSGDWRRQLELWQGRNPLTGAGGLSHEERIIWGLTVDYARVSLDERLGMTSAFVPAVDNWAICDTFCSNSKWVEKGDREQVWTFILKLLASGTEFGVRVGLILSLAHFLDDRNLSRTLGTVCACGFDDDAPYYVRMGVAWLFAEALCRHYDATLPFVSERRLGRWIHNKTIQKAIESWRVTPEHKDFLRTLRC